MEKSVISMSYRSKDGLDDNYTLYDDGTVVHEYDVTHNIETSGYNRSSSYKALKLKKDIKERLLSETEETYISISKQLLGL